jgi:hypothetical protein
MRATFLPRKADAPLVVHANAPLACTIALQRLKAISAARTEVPETRCNIQFDQPTACLPRQSWRDALHELPTEHRYRAVIREALYGHFAKSSWSTLSEISV